MLNAECAMSHMLNAQGTLIVKHPTLGWIMVALAGKCIAGVAALGCTVGTGIAAG